jgi:hypothetical protein
VLFDLDFLDQAQLLDHWLASPFTSRQILHVLSKAGLARRIFRLVKIVITINKDRRDRFGFPVSDLDVVDRIAFNLEEVRLAAAE